jgi:hypothetical protein
MWARARIEGLMNEMEAKGFNDQGIAQVTRYGLDFRLVTKYTSFVAVEEKVRNVNGKPETVQVPVEMPEGVSYEGVFGKEEADNLAEATRMPNKTMRNSAGKSAGAGGMANAQAALPSAPPPPAASGMGGGYGKAQGALAIRADEAETGGMSGGVRLDPMAFLGISNEAPYRAALIKDFNKALGDKLKGLKIEHGKQMMVRITLSGQGAVTKVEFLKDETGSAPAKQILEGVFSGLKFPAPGKEAAIVFFLWF